MKCIIAIMITLAVLLSMVSCNGGNTDPAVTTVGTTETTAAPETTVMTTAETTTAETELALSEFDINSEECLMYRLLDMTVEEIEAEFGEMTYKGAVAGGAPCYELTGHGVHLLYNLEAESFDAPLLREQYPESVETAVSESTIFPGIYVGMDSKDVIDKLGIDGISYSMADSFPGFSSSYEVNGYWIVILWDIPEEVSLKVEEAIIWGGDGAGDDAKAELIADMKSGDANTMIGRITISKNTK